MERRLAAIMAADVVGYSRLIRANEEGTLSALRALRADIVDPKLKEHGGRIVKLMGDGMLVEFPSAVDAVRATVKSQTEIHSHNLSIDKEKRIEFRAGINLGDVVVDGDDIHGDGVNIAARMEGLAVSGGICITNKVYEEVRDRLDFAFEDIGEQQVKNIGRPVRVWQWTPGTEGIHHEPVHLALPNKPSIAVLPFDNMSGDADQEFFVDGLTEDIITNLCRIGSLFVIARNSTFVFKGQPVNIEKVASSLGVQYVLEGSARKAGQKIRVTAQLIDAESSRHLWAEKYDRDLTDIFELQDEITRAVAASTQTQVVLNEGERRMLRADAAMIDLRDMVKLGWRYIYDLKPQSFDRALELSKKALELDEKNSGGHQLRSAALFHKVLNGYTKNSKTDILAAMESAKAAIELDSKDEYSHWLLGLTTFYSHNDHQAAIHELNRALDINPNFSLAYAALGTVCSFAGDADLGIKNCEMALRLNPRDPSNFYRYSAMAIAYFTEGHYEQCLEQAMRSLQGDPSWRHAHIMRIVSLVCLERIAEAYGAVKAYLEFHPDETVSTSAALPFKHTSHQQAVIDALRTADLPD